MASNMASINKPLNNTKPNNAKTLPSMASMSPFTNANTSFKNMGSSMASSPSIMKSMNTSMNGTVNTIKTSLSDAFSPVKDSINQSMENNSSMLTVPVMLGLGILVIALIIIIMFRNQVAYIFEVTWSEVKKLFEPSRKKVDIQQVQDKQNELNNAPLGTPGGVGNKPHMPSNVDHRAIYNMQNISYSGGKKEVFNIADNKYKYSDAEPLCKAYGAELATYDQVKEAWKKGADWCNYGWVKGQAAVYPTQESTYNKLQAGPEDQKRACGVTGVNGGYFDNPNLRFGVNCYGAKPAKSDADERAQIQNRSQTNDQLEYDRKVQDYKTELNIIPISPFNAESWE
jgi:hypothetical protein